MDELDVVLTGESAGLKIPKIEWNEAEISAQLDQMIGCYNGRVYDEASIRFAKSDRAEVNRIEKRLAEVQKRVTDAYREPVAEFIESMKAYRAKCKTIAAAIDDQVKGFENAAKEEKKADFLDLYEKSIGELKPVVPFEKLFDPKWLNASANANSCKKELLNRIFTVREELATLQTMCPGYNYNAVERVYLQDLNIRAAIAENQRLVQLEAAQKQKQTLAEAAAKNLQQPTEEEIEAAQEARRRAENNQIVTPDGQFDFAAAARIEAEKAAAQEVAQWYNFGAWLTKADIEALKQFFNERHIKYGKAKV